MQQAASARPLLAYLVVAPSTARQHRWIPCILTSRCIGPFALLRNQGRRPEKLLHAASLQLLTLQLSVLASRSRRLSGSSCHLNPYAQLHCTCQHQHHIYAAAEKIAEWCSLGALDPDGCTVWLSLRSASDLKGERHPRPRFRPFRTPVPGPQTLINDQEACRAVALLDTGRL